MMYCHNCGNEVQKTVNFCPNCGEKLKSDKMNKNSSDTVNLQTGRSDKEISEYHSERERIINERKLRNHLNNTSKGNDDNGYYIPKAFVKQYYVYFKTGYVQRGDIKDNEDGTFTIRYGIFKKYETYSWDEVEQITLE